MPDSPSTASLDTARQSYDTCVDRSVEFFRSRLAALVDPLITDINNVPSTPSSATDVFDRVIPAFSLGVGDSDSGLYGDYVLNLTECINNVTYAINLYVASVKIYTDEQLSQVESAINDLSSHVSQKASEANTAVSSLVEEASARYTSALTRSQVLSADKYVELLTTSFIAAVKRADDHLKSEIDTLFRIYDEYNALPSNFYNDVNVILTNISTDYNNSLTSALNTYNDGLSSYKYWYDGSSNAIASSQTRVGLAVDQSNAAATALFETVSTRLVYKDASKPYAISKTDYAFAVALAQFNYQLFNESIRIRNQFENLIVDIGRRAELIITSIDKFFKSSYKPSFVDGYSYRNAKASVINGASSFVSNDTGELITLYNDRSSVISNNFDVFIQNVHANTIDYINQTISGFTQEELDYISAHLSSSTSTQVDRVSTYFNMYLSRITNIMDGVSLRLTSAIDKYYMYPPLLRFTGSASSPVSISGVSDNTYTFEVTNLGKVPWVGWFGIRMSGGTVDDEGVEYPAEFRFNKRVGMHTITPGETRIITIVVPGVAIYNLDKLGSSVVSTLIVNTYGGISKLLIKS